MPLDAIIILLFGALIWSVALMAVFSNRTASRISGIPRYKIPPPPPPRPSKLRDAVSLIDSVIPDDDINTKESLQNVKDFLECREVSLASTAKSYRELSDLFRHAVINAKKAKAESEEYQKWAAEAQRLHGILTEFDKAMPRYHTSGGNYNPDLNGLPQMPL